MLTDGFIELIDHILKKETESQNLEVKSAHRGMPKRLYGTLSSFSNQDGGGVSQLPSNELPGLKRMIVRSPASTYPDTEIRTATMPLCSSTN